MSQSEALVFVKNTERARVTTLLGEYGLRPLIATGLDALPKDTARLAVIDPELLGASVDGLRVLQENLVRTPILFLSGPRRRENLALLIGFPDMVAVVPRDSSDSDHELRAAIRGIIEGPRFGWDGVVGGVADQFKMAITGSDSRDGAVDALTEFFERTGVRSRKSRVLVAAAEELITNAVYDAPVDLEGQPLYANRDRRDAVDLETQHCSEVRAATDAQHAAVLVRDPFGALRARTVRRFLSKGLRGGTDQIDAKLGGAGLGLTRIYEMADRFIVRIEPGKATEMVVVVATRGGRNSEATGPTSLRLLRTV